MPDASLRLREPELMDDPALDPAVHAAALRGLARLNRIARAHAATWRAIRAELARPGRVELCDVAAGAGDGLVAIGRRCRAVELDVALHACDVSPRALRHAGDAVRAAGLELHLHAADVVASPLPREFDVVACSLFLHHLDPPDVVRALRHMAAAARRLLVVQDLRRTRVGAALARVIPPLVTRSPVVHVDAVRSVRAAFTIDELGELARDAGLDGATTTPIWPQRRLLRWRRPMPQ